VVTERELIYELLDQSAAAVVAHDMPRVLGMIVPENVPLRQAVEREMGRVQIVEVRITERDITVNQQVNPPTATGMIEIVAIFDDTRQAGATFDRVLVKFNVAFVKPKDRWLVSSAKWAERWTGMDGK